MSPTSLAEADTWMLREAAEAPDVVARQLSQTAQLQSVVAKIVQQAPTLTLTVARGSSDHAANYFAYLCMQYVGVPVASLPMSIATLQHAPLRVKWQLAVAFSQSGRSPDLIDTMQILRHAKALTLACVNVADSPLAQACDLELNLHAGVEQSVAATKSYIAMLALAAQLVAHWSKNSALLQALAQLPDHLIKTLSLDWSLATQEFLHAQRMLVIGRGLGLAIAQEAALKLKETCGIQAEAFSSAEVRHGPMEIIQPDYPLLVFALPGPEQQSLIGLANDMRARGARVIVAAPQGTAGGDVPLLPSLHPALDPIAAILPFYKWVASLALALGRNPDQPRYLHKVTATH